MASDMRMLLIGVRGRGVMLGTGGDTRVRLVTPRRARLYASQLIAAADEAEKTARSLATPRATPPATTEGTPPEKEGSDV